MTDFKTFEEFYPYYLGEHSNRTNRRLHIIGTTLALLQIIRSVLFLQFFGIIYGLIIGYALAWIGHFFFEKNKFWVRNCFWLFTFK